MKYRSYKIIGLGGAGCNALSSLAKHSDLTESSNLLFVNTDIQSLEKCKEYGQTIELGSGLGAGANPEIGRQAYLDYKTEIHSKIELGDIIIILTGLGGGTGSGALTPLVRDLKGRNKLVSISTMPYAFEGRKRRNQAERVINELLKESHENSIIIENDTLREIYGNLTLASAFRKADELMSQIVEDLLFDHKISVLGKIPNKFISDCYRVKNYLGESSLILPNSAQIFVADSNEFIINSLLKNYNHVYKINPYKFEELLLYIYERMGTTSKLTKKSRDDGVDLLVFTPPPILGKDFLTIVQAKRYAKDRKISSQTIRELIGSKLIWNADKAQIITTSDYSKPAISTAQKENIDLIKFNELLQEFNKVIRNASS